MSFGTACLFLQRMLRGKKQSSPLEQRRVSHLTSDLKISLPRSSSRCRICRLAPCASRAGWRRVRKITLARSGVWPAAYRWSGVGNWLRRVIFCSTLDVFLMVSEPAGCPNASLEAMAAGLPVIATDVGGVSEQVIHGQTGLLVAPANDKYFAAAIAKLANDRFASPRGWEMPRAAHVARQFFARAHDCELCGTIQPFTGKRRGHRRRDHGTAWASDRCRDVSKILPNSLRAIAAQAGASVMTVSRVLRSHPGVKQETRRRILEIAEEARLQAASLYQLTHGACAQRAVFEVCFKSGVRRLVTRGLRPFQRPSAFLPWSAREGEEARLPARDVPICGVRDDSPRVQQNARGPRDPRDSRRDPCRKDLRFIRSNGDRFASATLGLRHGGTATAQRTQ